MRYPYNTSQTLSMILFFLSGLPHFCNSSIIGDAFMSCLYIFIQTSISGSCKYKKLITKTSTKNKRGKPKSALKIRRNKYGALKKCKFKKTDIRKHCFTGTAKIRIYLIEAIFEKAVRRQSGQDKSQQKVIGRLEAQCYEIIYFMFCIFM